MSTLLKDLVRLSPFSELHSANKRFGFYDRVLRFANHRNFELAVLFLFVVTITGPIRYNTYAMVFFAFWWLLSGRFRMSLERLKAERLYYLFLLFYGICAISLLYSENLKEGLKNLETRSSLIVLPVLLTGIRWDRKLMSRVLSVYVGTVLATTVFSLVSTFTTYRISGDNLDYFSWVLPFTSGLSANYYALFVSAAALILLFDSFERKSSSYLVLRWIVMFYLAVFLVLLGSRATMVSFVICFLMVIYTQVKSGDAQQSRKAYLFFFLLMILIGVLAVSLPYTWNRIKQIALRHESDPRFRIWRASVAVIGDNPVWGVGIGDVQDALQKEYMAARDSEAITNNYNPHNDWLQIYIGVGIWGLILFALIPGGMLHRATLSKNLYMYAFVISYVLASLTESLLERNKGIVIFTFFASLLFFVDTYKKHSTR